MNFIPHQLGLIHNQVKKIASGRPVIVPYHMMGSGAGDHIVLLRPQNARKLLTSFKKGKGFKLHLSPEELHHTILHGRGFKDFFHKASNFIHSALGHPAVKEAAKTGVKYGAEALGAAVGSALGSPEAGMVVGSILGNAGAHAIDERNVHAGTKKLHGDMKQKGQEIAVDTLHQNIKKLPPQLQPYATEALKEQTAEYGFGIKKHHYTTRKGDKVHHIGDHYVPSNIAPYSGGKLKKGSPEAKAFMAAIRSKKSGGSAISNAFKKAFNPNTIKHDFEKVVPVAKTIGHYVIPAAAGALGGIAGTALGGPMGGVAGSALGSYGATQIDKKLGFGMRKRGRPRKVGGALASASSAYQTAIRNNFGGLELTENTPNNAPLRNFKLNP
jgi:hypothetical protein